MMKLCNLLLHIGNRTQILLLTVLLTCLVYYDLNHFNTVTSTLSGKRENLQEERQHTYNFNSFNDVAQFLDAKDKEKEVERNEKASIENKMNQGNHHLPRDNKKHSSHALNVPGVKSQSKGGEERHVDSIEAILRSRFTPAAEIKSPSPEHINLGFIMINLNKTSGESDLSAKFKKRVRWTFYTMLQYWASSPRNLIIVSDEWSVPSVAR